jgi:hypothetical protein
VTTKLDWLVGRTWWARLILLACMALVASGLDQATRVLAPPAVAGNVVVPPFAPHPLWMFLPLIATALVLPSRLLAAVSGIVAGGLIGNWLGQNGAFINVGPGTVNLADVFLGLGMPLLFVLLVVRMLRVPWRRHGLADGR